MSLAAKDIRFQQQMQKTITRERQERVPELPEELSMFDIPQITDYFKMLAVIEHGSTDGWEKLRDDFIASQKQLPENENMKNQQAALLSMIAKKELTNEDQIMNDFSSTTNDVIQQMERGTVNIDDGSEKLQKMQIVEGDMPGQGKEKQGKWGGGNV